MGEYRTAICDNCGSESNFIHHKPEGWFYGNVHNINITFFEVDRVIKGTDDLMTCSSQCLKIILGSFFLTVKDEYERRCNALMEIN